jgi:hypothetical protein
MTQPMAVPRTGMTGLKPSKPGAAQGTRSTQRIVLPTPPGARPNSTKSLVGLAPGGKISLPIGMILRSLPPETLASDISEFEKTGAASTEIGLPMNTVLGQLPSGKVEMTLEDLIPLFPAGYLQPTEAISSYLPTIISLPLMDVVMRIPPDLLALRPDQKDVDASVINMADPFTEEILREQAETARRQSGANIIDESQAPQEEFVPSQSARSIAPPRRPSVEPLVPSRIAATTLAAPSIPTARGAPSISVPQRPIGSVPLPPAATAPATPPGARTPTGQIPTPVRMSAPLPPRQFSTPSVRESGAATADASGAPVPPVPRNTGPIPAPPPPRHTTSLPTAKRRTGTLASLSQQLTAAAMAAETPADSFIEPKPVAVAEPTPEEAKAPGAPDPDADDLQRLAALAMAQLGDSSDASREGEKSEEPAPKPVTSFQPPTEVEEPPVAAGEPEAAAEPATPEATEDETESFIVPPSQPAPEDEAKNGTERVDEPIRAPEPVTSFPVPEPIRAPALEPVATGSVNEPIRVSEAPIVPRIDEPIRAPAPPEHGVDGSSASVAFNLNTCTAEDLVTHIPDCTAVLAAAIIVHREKIGSYAKLEELLNVPGMTPTAYTSLTGEAPPPESKPPLSLNELLGFPSAQNLSLKDVTERIACWPDVTGCLLSQSSGLSLVGTAPPGLDKEAIVAFAPRMFEAINKSFSEVAGTETDALIVPSSGTSFHLFRNKDLYLIIMSRLPLMPERHVKVARFVLSALSSRRD